MSRENDAIEYLILNGALEVAGLDTETGEPLYNFTPKLKEVMPELYDEHLNALNSDLMNLWEKGFLNINFFETEPSVKLTEKAWDFIEIAKLPKKDQLCLQEIVRIVANNNLI